jgi:hypothetical protein
LAWPVTLNRAIVSLVTTFCLARQAKATATGFFLSFARHGVAAGQRAVHEFKAGQADRTRTRMPKTTGGRRMNTSMVGQHQPADPRQHLEDRMAAVKNDAPMAISQHQAWLSRQT